MPVLSPETTCRYCLQSIHLVGFPDAVGAARWCRVNGERKINCLSSATGHKPAPGTPIKEPVAVTPTNPETPLDAAQAALLAIAIQAAESYVQSLVADPRFDVTTRDWAIETTIAALTDSLNGRKPFEPHKSIR